MSELTPESHTQPFFARVRTRAAEYTLMLRIVPAMVLVGVLFGIMWVTLAAPPSHFNAPRIFRIAEGTGLRQAGQELKDAGLIRNRSIFVLAALTLGGEHSLIAGDYYFAGPQNAITLANRVTTGDYELEPVKVTLPEGATVREMAGILADKLAYFDAGAFLALADGKEGYLFPDTYYFLPTVEASTVVTAMENNFYRRIEGLEPSIAASGKTLHEIVTMASLLEEEANITSVRKMISGILWHRIDIGMKLQVDAVFPYILGKNTFQVTLEDLQVESPYNTYKNKGLPLGPISNPSLSSLEAAAQPTPSTYLYYLADMQGVTHYSRTYAEHMRKRAQYLGS